MLLSLPIGSTSKIIQIPIFDSSSTTGALLTGLAFNTASLTAYYNREGAAGAGTAITLATATKGTWATGGFVAVDGTNLPGWYELHIPDAALASGAKSVAIHLKGATNMVPVPILIELTATSNQDAVRGGMTAMPNVASGSAGAIIVSGTGTAALSVSSGLVTLAGVTHTGAVIPTVSAVTGLTAANLDATISSRMATYTQPTGFLAATFPGTVASTTNITAGTITTTTNLTNLPTIPANWLTAAGTAADFGAEMATAIWTDTTAGDFTVALSVGKSIMNGVALGTGLTINAYTGNTAQTGDAFARLGAPAGASVSADVAAVKVDTAATLVDTAEIGVAGAGLTNINLPNQTMDIVGNITGNLSGSVNSVTTGVTVATGGIGSGAIAAAELNNIADGTLNRVLSAGTDSGADNTTARTVRQALRGVRNRVAVAGGVVTVYKEDDVTASHTAAVTTTAGNPVSEVNPT